MRPSRKINSVLKGELAKGSLGAHAPFPSERSLVARFRVNRLTIRKALRLLVADGWIYSKERMGYFVSPPSRVGQVLVVIPEWGDARALSFLQGVYDGIRERQSSSMVIPMSPADFEAHGEDLGLAFRELSLVLLVFPGERLLAMAQRLHEKETAIGVYGGKEFLAPSPGVVQLEVPDKAIGVMAFDHLEGLGVRLFGCLRTKPFAEGETRARAFQEAHAKWAESRSKRRGAEGLKFMDLQWEHRFWRAGEPCPKVLEFLLGLQKGGGGLFAVTDQVAFRAHQVLGMSGHKVSMPIIGVDGLAWGAYTSPPLASILIPYREDGRRLFDMVYESLMNPGEPRHARSQVRVVTVTRKNSTGRMTQGSM
jgi:DNA-binding LacI/PurR family transcriptional regulator